MAVEIAAASACPCGWETVRALLEGYGANEPRQRVRGLFVVGTEAQDTVAAVC